MLGRSGDGLAGVVADKADSIERTRAVSLMIAGRSEGDGAIARRVVHGNDTLRPTGLAYIGEIAPDSIGRSYPCGYGCA